MKNVFTNCVFKNNVDTQKWFKAAGVRAVKTMAQTAIALIGTAQFVEQVNWVGILSGVALSGLVSFLTSVAGIPEVKAKEE